jgi:hypothetical protein
MCKWILFSSTEYDCLYAVKHVIELESGGRITDIALAGLF